MIFERYGISLGIKKYQGLLTLARQEEIVASKALLQAILTGQI